MLEVYGIAALAGVAGFAVSSYGVVRSGLWAEGQEQRGNALAGAIAGGVLGAALLLTATVSTLSRAVRPEWPLWLVIGGLLAAGLGRSRKLMVVLATRALPLDEPASAHFARSLTTAGCIGAIVGLGVAVAERL